ncbi:hypothetical protein EDD85DRAFT_739700, partial [Armillaria nabsnona]
SLNEIRSEGGPKTGNSCKSKWNNDKYHVVQALLDASRFHWDEKTGASITPESEHVWEAYCQSHPDAKEFKNQGWPFYDEVKSLMPIELQGKNV